MARFTFPDDGWLRLLTLPVKQATGLGAPVPAAAQGPRIRLFEQNATLIGRTQRRSPGVSDRARRAFCPNGLIAKREEGRATRLNTVSRLASLTKTLVPNRDCDADQRLGKPRPRHVGSIDAYDGALHGLFFMPMEVVPALISVLAANQFRYMLIRGSKLFRRSADVWGYSLKTWADDSDLPTRTGDSGLAWSAAQ